jgi:hypothetical protein
MNASHSAGVKWRIRPGGYRESPCQGGSGRPQCHPGSWGFHMEHGGMPPWDTRPDLGTVRVTRPEVVIRGYDDRGGAPAQRAVPPPGPRHSPRHSRSPSGPGSSRTAAYLMLTCLGILVLPGVIAAILWLHTSWSLSPAALLPPSPGHSGGSSVASGTTHASHDASGPGKPTRSGGNETRSPGATATQGHQVTAGGTIPPSAGQGARATSAPTTPATPTPLASAGGMASPTSPVSAPTSTPPASPSTQQGQQGGGQGGG